MISSCDKIENLVVHIGGHKTGTTAIQLYSAQNSELLSSYGICYPQGLFEDYPDQHSTFAILYSKSRRRDISRALKRSWKCATKQKSSVTFISGEELCNLRAYQIRHFQKSARKYYNNLSFIYVLRNRRQYLLSNFKHFLRYSSQQTEMSFGTGAVSPNPSTVIERWKLNFTENCKLLNYDDLKDALVPSFFREVFGVAVTANPRENYSLDMLTLQIYNTFLKEWSGEEMDALMWEFINAHPTNVIFKIESELTERLAARFSTKGWDPAELEKSDSLLTMWEPIPTVYDPVETCDRMISLFTMLRRHFELANSARIAGPVQSS
jgi:hypothetical protein